jgi:hypothetical protein
MGSYQGSQMQVREGASNANYSRQLLKAIGIVDGIVTSSGEEVGKLRMLDRKACLKI